jgi:RNA polymerase sigma-70 factor (ECF subfamily)
MTFSGSTPEDGELLDRAASGDAEAISHLLGQYRGRLKRMVACRMDDRLSPRIDPSDVVQEAFVVAAGNLALYHQQRPMPFYLWLRRITWQRLTDLHRRHLRAGRRSILREEPPPRWPQSTVQQLVKRLVNAGESPSRNVEKAELRQRVQAALHELEPSQRELLLLHYIEGLSLAEAGEVLQISAEAARMRHFRALKRLREYLDGEWEDRRS